MAKSILEYQEEDLGFSIKNITRSNFDLFMIIHRTIYTAEKSEHQIEQELDYMKWRLQTGERKLYESYPESEEFTEEMFEEIVEEYELEN
jgi:hypothetical protein